MLHLSAFLAVALAARSERRSRHQPARAQASLRWPGLFFAELGVVPSLVPSPEADDNCFAKGGQVEPLTEETGGYEEVVGPAVVDHAVRPEGGAFSKEETVFHGSQGRRSREGLRAAGEEVRGAQIVPVLFLLQRHASLVPHDERVPGVHRRVVCCPLEAIRRLGLVPGRAGGLRGEAGECTAAICLYGCSASLPNDTLL